MREVFEIYMYEYIKMCARYIYIYINIQESDQQTTLVSLHCHININLTTFVVQASKQFHPLFPFALFRFSIKVSTPFVLKCSLYFFLLKSSLQFTINSATLGHIVFFRKNIEFSKNVRALLSH